MPANVTTRTLVTLELDAATALSLQDLLNDTLYLPARDLSEFRDEFPNVSSDDWARVGQVAGALNNWHPVEHPNG
jgi:hypothetical protein